MHDQRHEHGGPVQRLLFAAKSQIRGGKQLAVVGLGRLHKPGQAKLGKVELGRRRLRQPEAKPFLDGEGHEHERRVQQLPKAGKLRLTVLLDVQCDHDGGNVLRVLEREKLQLEQLQNRQSHKHEVHVLPVRDEGTGPPFF